MKHVGVAVIGLGFAGSRAHIPSLRRISEVELIAISDEHEYRGQRLVEKYGYEYFQDYHDVIRNPDVDAVVLATPTPHHFQIARDSIKNGKHILCEMPLTTTEEQAIELGNMANNAGTILMPVLNFRFTPNYVKAKEIINERKFGSSLSFRFKEQIPAQDLAKQWPLSSWAWNKEESGGFPDYTLSVWSIDLVQWLFESEIDEVHWQSIYSPIHGIDNFKGYHTIGIVKLKNGAVGSLHYGSTTAEGHGTSELEIFGSKELTLRATWNNHLQLEGKGDTTQEWNFDLKGSRVWGHLQTNQHFIDCVQGKTLPQFGVEDAIKIQRIAKQMVQSSSISGT